MARLKGTGKDPLGRYGKGEVFDVPKDDPLYDELIEKGYADALAPEEDPAKSEVQVANALVSGQAITDPVEAGIAKELAGREHAVAQTGDPDATNESAGLNADPDAGSEDSRQVSPAAVSAAALASSDPEKSERLAEAAQAEDAKAEKAQSRRSRSREKAQAEDAKADEESSQE